MAAADGPAGPLQVALSHPVKGEGVAAVGGPAEAENEPFVLQCLIQKGDETGNVPFQVEGLPGEHVQPRLFLVLVLRGPSFNGQRGFTLPLLHGSGPRGARP